MTPVLVQREMAAPREFDSRAAGRALRGALCAAVASSWAQALGSGRAAAAAGAHIEQCSLTGGSLRCLAMSEFLRLPASSSVLPLSHSVVYDELAIAEPQPNVCRAPRTTLSERTERLRTGERRRLTSALW
jgi:hypothetical protein